MDELFDIALLLPRTGCENFVIVVASCCYGVSQAHGCRGDCLEDIEKTNHI